MPYVNTTFLPKTNGMVFANRLVARSDKGRVYGLGVTPDPLSTVIGAAWVTAEPMLELATAEATTATFAGGVGSVLYRHRLQSRVTGGDGTITNTSWTNTTNAANTVTYTLPASGVDVRFQSQAKDDNGQQQSFTGWRAVNAVTPP